MIIQWLATETQSSILIFFHTICFYHFSFPSSSQTFPILLPNPASCSLTLQNTKQRNINNNKEIKINMQKNQDKHKTKWNKTKKPQRKLNKTNKNHGVCFVMGNYSGTLVWLSDFPFYHQVPVANNFWAKDETLCLLCFLSVLWFHLVWTNIEQACMSAVSMSSSAHSTPHLVMCGAWYSLH